MDVQNAAPQFLNKSRMGIVNRFNERSDSKELFIHETENTTAYELCRTLSD